MKHEDIAASFFVKYKYLFTIVHKSRISIVT